MAALRWVEEVDHFESLAVCLRAILGGHGVAVGYDELVATLGLGAAITAVPNEPLETWPAFARDVELVSTAALYGLQLRDLHPPDAARGLEDSAEFPQHFVDSYIPLIRRAIENGQIALAWRGWPAPQEDAWGVITDVHGDRVMGRTMGHAVEPVPLSGAAHQVYVVEEFVPAAPGVSAAESFARVCALAARGWAGRWSDDPAILSGAAAYRCWDEWSQSARGAAKEKGAALATTVGAARRALARWLRTVHTALGREQGHVALAWADACERAASQLSNSAIASAEKTEQAFYATANLTQFAMTGTEAAA